MLPTYKSQKSWVGNAGLQWCQPMWSSDGFEKLLSTVKCSDCQMHWLLNTSTVKCIDCQMYRIHSFDSMQSIWLSNTLTVKYINRQMHWLLNTSTVKRIKYQMHRLRWWALPSASAKNTRTEYPRLTFEL